MPYWNTIRAHIWYDDFGIGNLINIHPSNPSTLIIHLFKIRKFSTQKCRLKFIKPAVIPLINVMIFVIRPVISKSTNLISEFLIIRHDSARITKSTKIFTWIEAEARCVSECTHLLTLIGCAMCLRTIFNHFQSIFPRKFHNRIHITCLTIEVNWHNSLCMACYHFLYKFRIDIECSNIRLN